MPKVSGSEYLDKIIHWPFCVPLGTQDRRRELLHSWLGVHVTGGRYSESKATSDLGELWKTCRCVLVLLFRIPAYCCCLIQAIKAAAYPGQHLEMDLLAACRPLDSSPRTPPDEAPKCWSPLQRKTWQLLTVVLNLKIGSQRWWRCLSQAPSPWEPLSNGNIYLPLNHPPMDYLSVGSYPCYLELEPDLGAKEKVLNAQGPPIEIHI